MQTGKYSSAFCKLVNRARRFSGSWKDRFQDRFQGRFQVHGRQWNPHGKAVENTLGQAVKHTRNGGGNTQGKAVEHIRKGSGGRRQTQGKAVKVDDKCSLTGRELVLRSQIALRQRAAGRGKPTQSALVETQRRAENEPRCCSRLCLCTLRQQTNTAVAAGLLQQGCCSRLLQQAVAAACVECTHSRIRPGTRA